MPREVSDGATWAVEFRCRPAPHSAPASGESPSEPSDEEVACGIRTGETMKFFVTLPYPSDSPEQQPILVDFSDGRTGIAS